MLEVRRALIIIATLTLMLGVLPSAPAYAATSCTATVSPTIISPGTESVLQFDIQNTGSDSATWVKIQRPTLSYSVNGITQSGWTDATDDAGTTLTAGTITAGSTLSLQLALFTAPAEEGAQAWSVQISPNADGSSAIACAGSLDTTIGTPPTPPTPNGESNIGLSHIAPTTATITWTSDTASTSYVYYGTTTAYGKIATAFGSTVDHTVVLTGLSPNTIYHYMVAGTTGAGDNFFSDDNTFITPEAPSPAPTTPLATPAPTSAKPTVPKVPGDTAPPAVTLGTKLTTPFAAAPELHGTATDNHAIATVEYSTDGGLNWLPVTKLAGVATATAKFSFTPILPEDGNYTIVLRAFDGNDNEGRSTPATLVIDRLPPQVGPLVLSYGPETLTPNDQGAINLLAGSDYKLMTSAVGGPISITLEATPVEQLGVKKTFTLTQSADSGLWAGVISFATSGIYQLTAKSIDGAGNQTSRPVLTVTIIPAGRITAAGTNQGISGAKITVYSFEPSTHSWHVWDGGPYSQTNPQFAKPDGHYSLVIPQGKYYLTVQAAGRSTFTSNSFEVTADLSLASDIPLTQLPRLRVGTLSFTAPDLSWQSYPLPPPANKPIAGRAAAPLAGQLLPDFKLPTIAGGTKRNLDLEGKPTVLTTLTTWSPSSQEQLGALADAQANPDINVVPVFVQEHETMVGVYLDTAGYTMTGLIDPDGTLVPSLQMSALPQHIFVDRSGRIKKVMLGLLSKQQLLDQLGGL